MVLNEAVPLRQRTLQQREDDVEVASQVAKRQNKNPIPENQRFGSVR